MNCLALLFCSLLTEAIAHPNLKSLEIDGARTNIETVLAEIVPRKNHKTKVSDWATYPSID